MIDPLNPTNTDRPVPRSSPKPRRPLWWDLDRQITVSRPRCPKCVEVLTTIVRTEPPDPDLPEQELRRMRCAKCKQTWGVIFE